MSETVNIKVTTKSYCGECQKDFSPNEPCFYTWFENDVFCYDCKKVINQRSNEKYLDWELRIFIRKNI